MITIHGSFLHKISMRNNGIPSMGDLEVADTLSEDLANENFLTVDTSGGIITDILLQRVALADTTGSSYMFKDINNSRTDWQVNIKFEMIPAGNSGSGLIDPTSAYQLFSVVCDGVYCDSVLSQAKGTLYFFVGMPSRGTMTVYGSKYVSSPLNVVREGPPAPKEH
jgi:hypothetical protein